jgi:chromatin remodeling complex protein RSC6
MNAATAPKTTKVAKKTKTEEVATPVAAPAAPVAAPKAKKAKAEPVAATPVAAAPVTTEATEATEPVEVRLEAEVKSLTARLMALREVVSELVTESKKLEKKSGKVQKVADKRRRRSKPTEGDASKPARVSIFQVPVKISPELCAFMNRPAGSEESRSNVTKYVTTYVKENNLKNKHDINPDAKLRALLRVPTTDKLTYFNLQKFLNVHYVKAVPASA